MNSADWSHCAQALETALESAGLVVEFPDTRGGNVHHWNPVTADQLMGCWLQRGYRIRDVSEPSPLSMVQEDDDEA